MNKKLSVTEPTEIYLPQFADLRDILNRHERAHWVFDEAKMDEDVSQWKRGDISESEKEFIKMILRLFTQADTDVCSGYVDKLLPRYKQAEARKMLLSFAARESTHMDAYKLLNDTLGYDSEDFMREFLDYQAMAEKHDFMIAKADMNSNHGRIEYLAKQILIEGVNLFASFAMLLNFKRMGKLPGMVSVNQWSITDESMHVEGLTSMLLKDIEAHPSVVNDEFKRRIYETAREVVRLEDSFIDLCYGIHQPEGLTSDDLKGYIRYVCDYRMQQIGLKAQFGITENPCKWIDDITGNLLGNFFEVTVVEYSKGGLSGDWVYPQGW